MPEPASVVAMMAAAVEIASVVFAAAAVMLPGAMSWIAHMAATATMTAHLVTAALMTAAHVVAAAFMTAAAVLACVCR